MNLQEGVEKARKKLEYNDEPIFYCKRCLSLKVMNIPYLEDSEFCDDCSSTDIGLTTIEEWEKLYKDKYHHSYLEEY